MTCIVGIEHADGVTIGGDSAGVSGQALTIRADHKVFARRGYVFGFTTSFRMGQLLRYAVDLPDAPARDLDRFMVTTFVNAIREGMTAGGYLKTDSGREESGAFLVGIRGRLYAIHSDNQIDRSASGYNAVGSGGDIAVGSLHTSAGLDLAPEQRARLALTAAAAFNTYVAPPFRIRTATA